MSTTATPSVPRSATRAADPAVSVAHVSKAFRLPHQQYHTLKERALHPFRSRSYDVLQAVDDISIDIAEGEFFGIIGRNGSGKSTLLKCIAGIYNIDAGDLRVRGRLSPFIELGVGFNMDLTARDNIIINAIMLGLSRKEALARFDQIIEFAELEEFLDLKLKNYSSGMQVRLAFSVAIQVKAEILLIDEVLAVGDARFQRKCFNEFERLKREGRTIVFVTHDMGAVERFCDRAMLLERGRMQEIGDPFSVARRYIHLNLGKTVHEPAAGGLGANDDGLGSADQPGSARILDAWFEDGNGGRVAELTHGQALQVGMEVEFLETVSDPVFGVTIRNEWGATIFATATDLSYGSTGEFHPNERVTIRLGFENVLAASRYTATPSVARSGERTALDLREDAASVVIKGGPYTGGVTNLPHAFTIEHL